MQFNLNHDFVVPVLVSSIVPVARSLDKNNAGSADEIFSFLGQSFSFSSLGTRRGQTVLETEKMT